jgi:hypothetical protein
MQRSALKLTLLFFGVLLLLVIVPFGVSLLPLPAGVNVRVLILYKQDAEECTSTIVGLRPGR